MLANRLLLVFTLAWFAGQAESSDIPIDQVKIFRAWMVTIVEDQVSRGANPRWNHRDCAGLVRFAVAETLARHNDDWRKANGFLGRPLPPEIEIGPDERKFFKSWRNSDGSRLQFVRALPLVQRNAVFIGKTAEHLEPGDLLFFDQGDDQHLMIWTGKRIVYHNGARPELLKKAKDNGLRAVKMNELLKWSDSRWQPSVENPNFIGFYRLSFLNSQGLRGSNE